MQTQTATRYQAAEQAYRELAARAADAQAAADAARPALGGAMTLPQLIGAADAVATVRRSPAWGAYETLREKAQALEEQRADAFRALRTRRAGIRAAVRAS